MLATVRRDNIEAEGKSWSAEEEEAFKKPIRDKIEAEGSPYYATARLWDDGIILPSETRRVLALAFSACLNAPVPETSSACSGCSFVLRAQRQSELLLCGVDDLKCRAAEAAICGRACCHDRYRHPLFLPP